MKMSDNGLPGDYELFGYQVAGHGASNLVQDPVLMGNKIGLITSKGLSSHVLKPVQTYPRGDREVHFYETLFRHPSGTPRTELQPTEEKPYRELCAFVPRYFGTKTVNVCERAVSFLELEDITAVFEEPCVMDIKIGARTWDAFATNEKIQRDTRKHPHAATLGFRILGLSVYRGECDRLKYNKLWGSALKQPQIVNALHEYTGASYQSNIYRRLVIGQMLERLERLHDWMLKQSRLIFYSSSILFVYEGKPSQSVMDSASLICQGRVQDPDNDCDPLRLNSASVCCDLRMIDFTHTFVQTDTDVRDENYLFGLHQLMHMLKLTRDECV